MARRYVSGTVVMTTGVGSAPATLGSIGDRMRAYVNGTTHVVEYRDPEVIFDMLQRNPGDTSDRPLYYTLSGVSALGRLQIYTYPPNSGAVTLALKNFVEKPPVLVDRPGKCVAAAGAAGALTGTYFYSITYVTADGETEGGPVSASITVAAKDISVTNIPVSMVGTVTSRKIYRNATGFTAPKLVATLADNTTTTYTDAIADVSLGAAVPTVSTAVSGLEKFPIAHHRTALLEAALTLIARNQGDSRSAGEFPQAALSAFAQMWAEDRMHHVPRRTPRYGARRSA